MKNFFLSRKLPLLIINSASLLSILLLLLVSLLSIYPSNTIRFIDRLFVTDFIIEFSNVSSNGTFLYPSFEFKNLKIIQESQPIIDASLFKITISIPKSLVMLRPEIINSKISDGKIYYQDTSKNTSEFVKINSNISFDHNNIINGNIHLIKNNVLGSLFFSSKSGDQRYLVNLPENDWLAFLPIEINAEFKKFRFSINMIGNDKNESLNSIGHFRLISSDELLNEPYKVNGDFIQSYKNNISLMSFKNLNKPFLNESNLLSVDFTNEIIRLSDLFLSKDLIKINALKNISTISLKNLTYIFNSQSPFFSSAFSALKIDNIYLDSIENLSGIILANKTLLQFKLEPSQALLRTIDGSLFEMRASGDSSYIFNKKQLNTKILLEKNKTQVEFHLLNSSEGKYEIDLIAEDISSKLFIALLPKDLSDLKSNLTNSLKSNSLNNLIFSYKNGFLDKSINYLSGSISSNNFNYEINSTQVIQSNAFDLSLKDGNISIALNLGKYNSIPFRTAKIHIDPTSQALNYISEHELGDEDIQIKGLTIQDYLSEDGIVLPIQSVGRVNIKNFDNVNFTKLSFNNLDLEVSKDIPLKNLEGRIFISNFKNAYGSINGDGFSQNFDAIVRATSLDDKPSLFLSTQLEIDMDKVLPSNDFLWFTGKEKSKIKLSFSPDNSWRINIFSNLIDTKISSQIAYFKKPLGTALDTQVTIHNIDNPNILIQNNLFETLILFKEDQLSGYFKSGNYFNKTIKSTTQFNKFKIYIDIPELNFEDLNFNQVNNSGSNTLSIDHLEFHFNKLMLLGNTFNAQTGKIKILGDATQLSLKGNDLNGIISIGNDGFTKVSLKDSTIKYLSFQDRANSEQLTNMRFVGEDIDVNGIKINFFDFYILENSDVITINDIKVRSKNINIQPLNQEEKAYVSYNKKKDLYKVKGIFELNKPSKDISRFIGYDFEYLKSNMNVEWISAKQLNNLQGKLSFLVKDLKLEQEVSNSVLLKALGIFNLKSFFSTLSEIDLSDKNRNNLNINRGAGGFIFMSDRARISDPLFIETNFAKMKWIGDIQKDRRKNLSDLDLFLEMRLTISDNLPWYGAFLGGFPAVAGGMVIGSIFEKGINDISTINYQVTGNIDNPQLLRLE